jgi:4-hydroxy-tetrahydrodipicolinate synthase
MLTHRLSGIYAAAVTPLKPDFSIYLGAIPPLLDFFAKRGCHGVLLFGTTGEGPSFSPQERIEASKTAMMVKQAYPDFKLFMGVGTPSLDETVSLTKAAFEIGFDGVLSLPPYYFRKVSDDGLFTWFSEVIKRAVPGDGAFFAYHIPSVSGVAVSPDLMARLKDAFPAQFMGVKDSSGDAEYGKALCDRFGDDLIVYCGTDPLLQNALKHGGGGAITAPANLFSPELRQMWDAHVGGTDSSAIQKRIETYRTILDKYQPAPASLKALLARMHNLPNFPVRPPVMPISKEVEDLAYSELEKAGLI